MRKQEHYFILCFFIVIGLLIFYKLRTECKNLIKWKPLEGFEVNQQKRNIVENFTSPTFQATNSYTNIVVSDDEGNLTTNSLSNVIANGLTIKEWTISQAADKKLCFTKSGVAKPICFTADVESNTSGALNDGSGIKFGDQEINETKMKKLEHLKMLAGFAINGEGTTFPLYEGDFKLMGSDWADAYTQDKWDYIYINRGWKVTVFEHEKDSDGGWKMTEQNVDTLLPKRWLLDGRGDAVSRYKAEWIGY